MVEALSVACEIIHAALNIERMSATGLGQAATCPATDEFRRMTETFASIRRLEFTAPFSPKQKGTYTDTVSRRSGQRRLVRVGISQPVS